MRKLNYCLVFNYCRSCTLETLQQVQRMHSLPLEAFCFETAVVEVEGQRHISVFISFQFVTQLLLHWYTLLIHGVIYVIFVFFF